MLVESFESIHISADQHWRAALGKLCGEYLLVTVAQALAAVDDEGAPAFSLLQNIGAIDIFVIKRGVLAHQDHIQLGQVCILGFVQREPGIGVVKYRQFSHACPGHTLVQVKVFLLHVVELPVPGLGSPQHGQSRVFFVVNIGDRIHHHAQLDRHCLVPPGCKAC